MKIGQPHTKETRRKISRSRTGKLAGHVFWGNRVQTEETKAKLRAARARQFPPRPIVRCANPSCASEFRRTSKQPRKRFCSISCARKVDGTLGVRSRGRTPPKGSGRCGWYAYRSPIAGEVLVQGTWELRVARCLDAEGLPWRTNHNRDRFAYLDRRGAEHTYSPDFLQGNEYLEVKGHLAEADAHKIAAVRAAGVAVRVIRWDDLREWETRLFGRPLAGTNANKAVRALAVNTISGTTITFLSAPLTGDKVRVSYVST